MLEPGPFPTPSSRAPGHLGVLAPLTAGRAGAVHRGHPEVGGARVEDDGKVLWWGANGDGAEVFHLQEGGGRGQGVCGGEE